MTDAHVDEEMHVVRVRARRSAVREGDLNVEVILASALLAADRDRVGELTEANEAHRVGAEVKVVGTDGRNDARRD